MPAIKRESLAGAGDLGSGLASAVCIAPVLALVAFQKCPPLGLALFYRLVVGIVLKACIYVRASIAVADHKEPLLPRQPPAIVQAGGGSIDQRKLAIVYAILGGSAKWSAGVRSRILGAGDRVALWAHRVVPGHHLRQGSPKKPPPSSAMGVAKDIDASKATVKASD